MHFRTGFSCLFSIALETRPERDALGRWKQDKTAEQEKEKRSDSYSVRIAIDRELPEIGVCYFLNSKCSYMNILTIQTAKYIAGERDICLVKVTRFL